MEQEEAIAHFASMIDAMRQEKKAADAARDEERRALDSKIRRDNIATQALAALIISGEMKETGQEDFLPAMAVKFADRLIEALDAPPLDANALYEALDKELSTP